MKISSLIFLVLTVFTADQSAADINCSSVSAQPVDQNDSIPIVQTNKVDFEIKYNLEEPDQTFDLPEILEEISGLGFDKKYEKLYAVQDENGIVFVIDKTTGEVEKEIKFHKDGDYEGIEVVGDVVYVVKSTGTIYEVKNLGEDDQEMEKYNLFLSRENDVEGFCFDKETTNQLLIGM